MNLIVFGQAGDPHVADLMPHLEFDRIQVIDHYMVPPVALRSTTAGSSLILDDQTYDLAEPTAFLYRIKPNIKRFRPHDFDPEDDLFRQESWRTFVMPIPDLFDRSIAFNGGFRGSIASNKILQDRTARALGLTLPDTVFSNSSDHLDGLGDQVAYKVIGKRNFPGARGMTERVTPEFLAEHADHVRQVPAIYQTYTDKDFEIRAIISRTEAEAVRINSQKKESTVVDWRYDQSDLDCEAFDLPSDIVEKCQQFLIAFDIDIGQFDFIVTKDGGYVFLECNPDGQWVGYSHRIQSNWEVIFANAVNALKERMP